jgi:aspartyl-tRNA(Asn)/glutamyl-tRNA(Gln) amidotransferase subunit B
VNLSLNAIGASEWGTRSETKNVNSLRSVERAVRSEIERQADVLSSGGRVKQETRHFHEDSGLTTSGRSKEQAEDYRYFPEPDLVPIVPSSQWIEELRATLPELPFDRRRRLRDEWGISALEMQAALNAGAVPARDAYKWWMGELARQANERRVEVSDLPVTPEQVARIVALIAEGKINDKLARQVLDAVLEGVGSPDDVINARGLAVVSDDGALGAAVDEAIAADPDAAQKVRDGKVAAAGALVGAVMKLTRGQADAARVRELVLEKLGANG